MRRIIFMHTGGGGHTSPTKAIIEALDNLYGDEVESTVVDVLKDYAPKTLNLAPEAYSRLLSRSVKLFSRRRADQLLKDHQADVIVSTFHFSAGPVLDALERRGHPLPFINVITNLVTIPPVWFDARADATIVPTEPAYHQAILAGVPIERLHRIGLPVSPRFVPTADKAAVRHKLGWPTNTAVVLLMAGSDGVSPIGSLAEAIVASGLPVTPAIVTGRNQRMARRLRNSGWAQHCILYDFVEDMPTLMQAADLLITKAGPDTLTEALNTHLPTIIFSRAPGQDEGSTEYVTHTGAGYSTPRKRDLIATLRYLLGDPEALQRAAAAAGRLATPNAATDVAKLVMNMASGRPARSD